MSSGGDFVRQLQGSSDFAAQPTIWQRLHIDLPLLLLLLILSVAGLSILYSANGQSLPSLYRQCVFFGVAYMVMLVVAQFSPSFMRRWAPFLFVIGIILLVLVPFFGTGVKGARRWLSIAGLPRFQPSEVLKLVMPLMIAWYLSKQHLPPTFRDVLVSVALVMVPAMLIVIQPDLGTSILIAASGLFVLFLAGLGWHYIGIALLTMLGSAYPLWIWGLKEYQKQRILTLLNPENDKLGAGWNIIQSQTAIGSGGISGKGWMAGTQSQLDFLPESHTDFIIAVLAEEFGLKGVLLLLSLYFAIIARGIYISLQAQDSFSRLAAGSITLTFFVYVAVNMGMVSGVLPVVGVPLPLVSQGGTSIVTLMAGFGVLMSISTEQRKMGL